MTVSFARRRLVSLCSRVAWPQDKDDQSCRRYDEQHLICRAIMGSIAWPSENTGRHPLLLAAVLLVLTSTHICVDSVQGGGDPHQAGAQSKDGSAGRTAVAATDDREPLSADVGAGRGQSRPAAIAVASAPFGAHAHAGDELVARGSTQRMPAAQEGVVATDGSHGVGVDRVGSVGQPAARAVQFGCCLLFRNVNHHWENLEEPNSLTSVRPECAIRRWAAGLWRLPGFALPETITRRRKHSACTHNSQRHFANFVAANHAPARNGATGVRDCSGLIVTPRVSGPRCA